MPIRARHSLSAVVILAAAFSTGCLGVPADEEIGANDQALGACPSTYRATAPNGGYLTHPTLGCTLLWGVDPSNFAAGDISLNPNVGYDSFNTCTDPVVAAQNSIAASGQSTSASGAISFPARYFASKDTSATAKSWFAVDATKLVSGSAPNLTKDVFKHPEFLNAPVQAGLFQCTYDTEPNKYLINGPKYVLVYDPGTGCSGACNFKLPPFSPPIYQPAPPGGWH